MNKVLVTGATGFIGISLIKHLMKLNLKIRVLLRNKNKSTFPDSIEIFEGDLTEPKSLINSCNDIDAVFHLGGYAHAWAEDNIHFVQKHYAINFEGTQNLAREASKAGIKKFIFFSSVKAVADSEKMIDEAWEGMPNSPYGIAKREAEKLVLSLKDSFDMHICILRLPIVYGPAWKGNLSAMLRAVNRGTFPPLPKLNNQRSMVSVEDVCQAAILAATHANANGKIYFVTDGKKYSTTDIYNEMREGLGKPVQKWGIPLFFFKALAFVGDIGYALFNKRMPFNSEMLKKIVGSACYNSSRIESELGFVPGYDFKKMLPFIIKLDKN